MAHGQSPIIKCEIDSVHCVINKSSSLVGNSATLGPATAMPAQPNVNDGSGATSHSGAGNARTGSRRIFHPQFKLQVLESYRNDSDCKGNQRATARKYGIHRRQIQKWLQCEKSLRASAANHSQNNVKHHQFHNITHHQPSSAAATAIGAASTAAATTTPAPAIAQTATAVNTHTTSGAYAHNNNNNLHYHHHQSYKIALDAARHSVALASSPPTVNPATAPSKCMNGITLVHPGAPTNTMPLRQPYTQTPAIKPVLHIQPHQSALHHHHQHQLHHLQCQHDVHMPSECLLERPHELLEHPPMNVPRTCFENFHRPQPQYAYEYRRPHPLPGAPIDLSVGPRRPHELIEPKGLLYIRSQPVKSEGKWYKMPETNNNDQTLEVKIEAQPNSPANHPTSNPAQAVDLTCRKRGNHAHDPASPPEKIQKTENMANAPTKPVKLFKPYLLDNGDPKKSDSQNTKEQEERKDAIIWSHHPAAAIPSPHYDTHSNHSSSSNFQPSSHDPAYTFPLGSPQSSTASSPTIASMATSKFQSSPAPSLCDRVTPPSANLPSSPAAVHATTLMWCPKGSPVSGYDTASNYSDSSELHAATASTPQSNNAGHPQSFVHPQQQQQSSPRYDPCFPPGSAARYSLDVKLEPIDAGGYYHHNLHDVTPCRGIGPINATFTGKYSVRHNQHEVQRWLLDHETNHRRHGIALYV